MSGPAIRVASAWLDLREAADGAARSAELVTRLRDAGATPDGWVVHDLACGTGAMGRWLAPQLDGPQRWVLHDLDDDLLARAAATPPAAARDGAAIEVQTRRTDITRLGADDLDAATLVTCSALLDLLTGPELDALAEVCAHARCPVLFTLSVTGEVALTPRDPLDGRVAAAFDAHQRRGVDRGQLLGPDAPARAAEAFTRLGAEVHVRESPWRLGAEQSALMTQWLAGWMDAAREQDAELMAATADYARRRHAELGHGALRVTVGHADLLALPAGQSRSKREDSA
jgi:hypothetical protein